MLSLNQAEGTTKPFGRFSSTVIDEAMNFNTTSCRLLMMIIRQNRFCTCTWKDLDTLLKHHTLQRILTLAGKNEILASHPLRLLKHDLYIVHMAGVKHQIAGAPTILPRIGVCKAKLEDGVLVIIVALMKSHKKTALFQS